MSDIITIDTMYKSETLALYDNNEKGDMDKINNRTLTGIVLLALFAVTIAITGFISSPARAAQATVNLGGAAPFAILAGTPNITDASGSSVITGNVGLAPASGAGITGLNCADITGTIYSVDGTGPACRVTNGPLLVTAKNNLTAAYTDTAGRTPVTPTDVELGGETLVAGVYNDPATTRFQITAGAGDLVLDGQGDPSSVFIFQAPFNGNGLTVGPGSAVTLINGAQACNVFWLVDTASLGTTADFVGTILALNSITATNGATVNGRLLARNGNVTLDNNTITAPICAGNDTADNGDGSGAGQTPGFPNTGRMIADNALWLAIPTFIILAAVSAAVIARKKHLI